MNDSNFNVLSYIVLLAPTAKIIRPAYVLTPKIPHPATQFDNIYTCMQNFKDVLMQKYIP